MKKCVFCSNLSEDNELFCANCGQRFPQTPQQPYNGYAQAPNQQGYGAGGYAPQQNQNGCYPPQAAPRQNGYYQQNGAQGYNQYGAPPVVPPPQPKMGWYKFLKNFALIASPILNTLTAILMFTGGLYFVQSNGSVTAEDVYSYFGGGMQVIDYAYAVLLLIFSAYCIYSRIQLAGFKRNAPTLVNMLYGIGAGMSLIYNLAASVIMDDFSVIASSVPSVVISVVFMVCTITNIKQIKYMFVN